MLAVPSDELCQPYTCPREELFYLPRYRNNAKANPARRIERRNLVLAAAQKSIAEPLPSAKQKSYHKRRQPINVLIDQGESFRNKMIALARAYRYTEEPILLERTQNTLQLLDGDLKSMDLLGDQIQNIFEADVDMDTKSP